MEMMRKLILKNRHTLLNTVLAVYVLVLVVEGAITGREARVFDFENPFFDINISNFEDFMDERSEDREQR